MAQRQEHAKARMCTLLFDAFNSKKFKVVEEIPIIKLTQVLISRKQFPHKFKDITNRNKIQKIIERREYF